MVKPKVEKAPKEPKAPKVVKPPVPSFPLPWMGVANSTCCSGLRMNHGLHTQCTMLPSATSLFCAACQKRADAHANGKPDHGTVEDRLAVGLNDYRCPQGKRSTPYTSVMKKLKITREAAEAEARKLGMEIPEECFAERTPVRSKKDATASDTDSASSAAKAPGRPKKKAKAVVGESADDLIAALVAQANATQPSAVVASSAQVTVAAESAPTSEASEELAPASGVGLSAATEQEQQMLAIKRSAEKRAAKAKRRAAEVEALKLAAEKLAAEKLAAEKLAAEKLAAEKVAAEKAEWVDRLKSQAETPKEEEKTVRADGGREKRQEIPGAGWLPLRPADARLCWVVEREDWRD